MVNTYPWGKLNVSIQLSTQRDIEIWTMLTHILDTKLKIQTYHIRHSHTPMTAHATKTITVSSNAMHINFCTKTNKWKKNCCYNVHICLVSSSSNGIFGIASNVNKNKTTNELREGNRKLARWNIGRQVVVIENEHWNDCLQLIFSGDSGQNSFSVVVKIIHLVTEYWIVAVLSQRPLCSFL